MTYLPRSETNLNLVEMNSVMKITLFYDCKKMSDVVIQLFLLYRICTLLGSIIDVYVTFYIVKIYNIYFKGFFFT